ncbi:MAG: hypothetical protein KGL63_09730 [Betaproteobacteria bacterium]|uniref:hypothetical protein n=1 Tax=Acidiphilium multivorum TaxID=62140 RepID=UPI001F4BE6BB|nr:hypothetical protein [Acidiphilium multivorum]MDE2343649.1 hypothetical protein [Betaproteobacteria bacterium]UNC16183.1 hypothetical protein FE249_18175 [Acidiphilium multivorum]
MPLDEHTTDDLGWSETDGADGQYHPQGHETDFGREHGQDADHAPGDPGSGPAGADQPHAHFDGGDGDDGLGGEDGGYDEIGEGPDQEVEPAPRRSRGNKVITVAGCGVALLIAFFGYQFYQQTHERHLVPAHRLAESQMPASHAADASLPTRPSTAAPIELGGSMSAPIMPQAAGAGAVGTFGHASTSLPKTATGSNTAPAVHSPASLPGIRQNAPAIAGMAHPGAPPPALLKAIDDQGAMLKALLKSTSATAAAEKNAQAAQAKEINDLETKLGAAQADITKMSGEITTLQATLVKQQAVMTAEKATAAKPEHAVAKAMSKKYIHHAATTSTRRDHGAEDHLAPHHVDPNRVLTGWSLTMVSRTTDQVEAPGGRREFVRPGQSVKGLGVVGHVVPYRTPAGVSSYQLFTSEGRILPRLGG